MSDAKATVDQYVVLPATVQANTDAMLYVTQQQQILAAAAAAAAIQIAAGMPQGAVVAAMVPVITALVVAFPPQVTIATAVAQAAFA